MTDNAPEHGLPLLYAPLDRRAGLEALLSLDRALGAILRTTREPLVGQMRLVWWRDALARLDTAPPPAEPVLIALAREVLPHGVTGASLATLVDGWEELLSEPLVEGALAAHASRRGGGVFGAAAVLLGGEDQGVMLAGEGWALADLAANLSDPAIRRHAAELARGRLQEALRGRWPRRLRALGALAWLARLDLKGQYAPGHPARVWRLLRFRLTGR